MTFKLPSEQLRRDFTEVVLVLAEWPANCVVAHNTCTALRETSSFWCRGHRPPPCKVGNYEHRTAWGRAWCFFWHMSAARTPQRRYPQAAASKSHCGTLNLTSVRLWTARVATLELDPMWTSSQQIREAAQQQSAVKSAPRRRHSAKLGHAGHSDCRRPAESVRAQVVPAPTQTHEIESIAAYYSWRHA